MRQIHNTPDLQYIHMEKKVFFAFLYILVFPALLFLLSGDFIWPEGWIFSLWFIVLCFSTILYLYRKDPASVSYTHLTLPTNREV